MHDAVITKFLEAISGLNNQVKEMYLFGSRSREDWSPDSDYDILVIVEKKEREIIDSLYDGVMDILLSTGSLISLKIFTVSEYNRLKSIPTPFMKNVLSEGIKIGHHHQRTN